MYRDFVPVPSLMGDYYKGKRDGWNDCEKGIRAEFKGQKLIPLDLLLDWIKETKENA